MRNLLFLAIGLFLSYCVYSKYGHQMIDIQRPSSRLQTAQAQTSQTQPNYQAQPNNFKMSDKQQREFNNLRDEQAAQNRGSMKEHWEAKLLGKKVVDGAASEASTFSKNDLPSGHRVLGKDSMMTLDYRPERLNVHVDEDGTCNRISMG